MKSKNEHLTYLLPETRAILDKSKDERIAFSREEKWITYPVAKDIFTKMENLINYPRKTRMPGMLLVGETNNGKTSLIKTFLKRNPAIFSEDWQETTQIPVIAIQAPPSPNLSDLYTNILNQFAVPFKNSDKSSKKEQQIKYYFGLCRLKMLIIDEIHNILSGPVAKQKVFMNAIKNLSNDLQISIVLVGIKDALHATNTDGQISNRFKPVFLQKWKIDRDYLSLLASIEKILPLKKHSDLAHNKELALKILDLSEGYIGEIIDLITQAVEYAIKNDIEMINVEVLKKCEFVKPSLRKNFDDMVSL